MSKTAARQIRVRVGRFVLPAILALVLISAVGFAPMPTMASIVDVSGISVPPVNGPTCPDCPGGDCNRCNEGNGNDSTGDSGQDNTSPAPHPAPTPTPNPAPTPVQQPQPVTDPQQVFAQNRQALMQDFQMGGGLMTDVASAPSVDLTQPIDISLGNGPLPTGLSNDEWKQAAACQQQLDEMYKKWPLSADEIALADRLEAQRNALWAKAISIPGLTGEERERLRLKLHTLNPQPDAAIPTVSADTVKLWTKAPPPLPSTPQTSAKPAPAAVNPVTSALWREFITGQAEGVVELGGESWADQIIEDNSFGNVLGIAKIAVAYKEGGASSALAATADALVGLISIPQAGMAVEGGRQYANAAYQIQNVFMTNAMKVTGGEFDKEKFWSDFNDDLTPRQKAVKEWIGYGTE